LPPLADLSKTEIKGPAEPVDFLGRQILYVGRENGFVANVSRKQISKIISRLEEDYTLEQRRKEDSNFQETIVDLRKSISAYRGIYMDAFNYAALDSELRAAERRIISDILVDIFGEDALAKVSNIGRDFLGIGELDVAPVVNDLED